METDEMLRLLLTSYEAQIATLKWIVGGLSTVVVSMAAYIVRVHDRKPTNET